MLSFATNCFVKKFSANVYLPTAVGQGDLPQ